MHALHRYKQGTSHVYMELIPRPCISGDCGHYSLISLNPARSIESTSGGKLLYFPLSSFTCHATGLQVSGCPGSSPAGLRYYLMIGTTFCTVTVQFKMIGLLLQVLLQVRLSCSSAVRPACHSQWQLLRDAAGAPSHRHL